MSTRKRTSILLSILGCDECPKVSVNHTPGSGYAQDYYCTAVTPPKMVMGYIEWDREKKEVPGWCPFRVICN